LFIICTNAFLSPKSVFRNVSQRNSLHTLARGHARHKSLIIVRPVTCALAFFLLFIIVLTPVSLCRQEKCKNIRLKGISSNGVIPQTCYPHAPSCSHPSNGLLCSCSLLRLVEPFLREFDSFDVMNAENSILRQ